jgi:transcriptional regulator GlxA family with amidase domain
LEVEAHTKTRLQFQAAQENAALAVLPLWIRVRRRERHANEWLNSTLRFLRKEIRQASLGSEAIVARLIDLIFVEAVRTWLEDPLRGSAGWLGGLRDPVIGAALGLLHKNPEKAWTVPSLAAQVGKSRSPFAARFVALVGQSRMSYLKRWRLQLAARLLQDQSPSLAMIAGQVDPRASRQPSFAEPKKRWMG